MSAERDQPGPEHKPLINALPEIEGVVIGSSPFVEYGEDNLLTELYRPEWVGIFAEGEAIEHLYTVHAPSGGMREEWYYHEHTTDRYMVLNGLLNVGLYDGRENSETFGNFKVVNLGEPNSGRPDSLRIPPLVWHSLQWESVGGFFLNAKLPGYVRNTPDKFRIQPKDYPASIVWGK
jgi:dTDP-4-dehydrorhamnose 3,5-epimerase